MRAPQPKRHKTACDQCNASKLKCPGGGLPCKRCADTSQICNYSLARRIGKPPGSKNRKTLERLRQAGERSLGDNGGSSGDSSTAHDDGGRSIGCGASNVEGERLERHDVHDPLRIPGTTSFWPLSPLVEYHPFPDSSQFMPAYESDFLDGDHDLSFNGGDGSTLHPGEPKSSDLGGLDGRCQQGPLTDARNDCWNSSAPSTTEQFSPGCADTDSPPSAYSLSSIFEPNKSISLDTVMARLEETAGFTFTPREQREPKMCRCLQKYVDILCKLQAIEKRQCPVQVDTLLTCANLVLNITEGQLRCNQCLGNSCVAMQLAMTFRTIFTWSQGQFHPLSISVPKLRMTLGQHEMAEDECSFVKTALISRALDRATALLKVVLSRIERVASSQQGRQSWRNEEADFWNLQQVVSSLVQSHDLLSKKLKLGLLGTQKATEGR